MSIKEHYTALAIKADVFGAMWANYWPQELARGEPAALAAWKREKARDIEDRAVLQYFFFIPIFVAYDSVDVWAGRELFRLDPEGLPIEVAGVPPDYFSADGQLWGNPLYDWDVHAKAGFAWWIRRVKAALSMYDIVRIDHFRGFEANWAVPYGRPDARTGTWRPGPGRGLFRALQGELGQDLPVIAEDLGLITPEVHALRDEFGLPGMRVLQFAFNADESGAGLDAENGFLPHNYEPNAFVYTGTHDNDTLRGWLQEKATALQLGFIDQYLGAPTDRVRGLMREALKSVAAWAVIPLQDVLASDNRARMNTPSTLGGLNWAWRMERPGIPAEASDWLKRTSALFNRKA